MKPESLKILKQVNFMITRTKLQKLGKYSYYSEESGLHLLVGTDNLENIKVGVGFKNEPPVKSDDFGHLPAHYLQSCINSGKQFKEFINSFNIFVDDHNKNIKEYKLEQENKCEYSVPISEWKGKNGVTGSLGEYE